MLLFDWHLSYLLVRRYKWPECPTNFLDKDQVKRIDTIEMIINLMSCHIIIIVRQPVIKEILATLFVEVIKAFSKVGFTIRCMETHSTTRLCCFDATSNVFIQPIYQSDSLRRISSSRSHTDSTAPSLPGNSHNSKRNVVGSLQGIIIVEKIVTTCCHTSEVV